MRIAPVWFITACGLLFIMITGTGMLLRVDDLRRTPFPVEPGRPQIYTLSFAGDIMAHDVNFHLKPYDPIYEDISEYLQNDLLSFGNLEFPIDSSKPYQNYPLFNNHPAYVEAAIEAGFDIFSAANNHTADQGPESILATRDALERFRAERGIDWSGIRGSKDDPMVPVTIERNGIKIGFLAITLFLNRPEGGELVYKVNYRSRDRQETFFKYLESVRPAYDLFILSVHGGVEYRQTALPFKVEFFHRLSECGADIVWGHHPHVLQPYEVYSRADGSSSVIIYSAGNFISGQTWHMPPVDFTEEDPPRGETALYQVRLVKSAADTVSICGVSTVPLVNFRDPGFGMLVRRYEGIHGDEAVDPVWRQFFLGRNEPLKQSLNRIESRNQVP